MNIGSSSGSDMKWIEYVREIQSAQLIGTLDVLNDMRLKESFFIKNPETGKQELHKQILPSQEFLFPEIRKTRQNVLVLPLGEPNHWFSSTFRFLSSLDSDDHLLMREMFSDSSDFILKSLGVFFMDVMKIVTDEVVLEEIAEFMDGIAEKIITTFYQELRGKSSIVVERALVWENATLKYDKNTNQPYVEGAGILPRKNDRYYFVVTLENHIKENGMVNISYYQFLPEDDALVPQGKYSLVLLSSFSKEES